MEKIGVITLLFILGLLQSCSHHRSGRYVYDNGKWVFESTKVGFNSTGFGSRVDATPYIYAKDGEFIWPVPSTKKISSNFGSRNGKHHDGIDIPAVSGTHIIASAGGRVSYAGWMRGYGRVVVIKHDNGHHTVYAHNSKNYVKKNQKVSQGEVIAKVGSSGRSTGPHLHFEIRKNNKVRNPASYLARTK